MSLFAAHIAGQPALLPVLLLISAVLFVNGWTDAPNAITTAVASGVLSFRRAAALAAACNLTGCLFFSRFSAGVTNTVLALAGFGPDPRQTLFALAGALLSIVLWSVLCWYFGIPTSESHALLAGLAGAAAALGQGFTAAERVAWLRIALGLFLSTVPASLLGRAAANRFAGLRLPSSALRLLQKLGVCVLSFLHGAQDGQKFLGLFLLAAELGGRNTAGAPPLWLAGLCALVMAAGTCLGGRRIVETVGTQMVRLDISQACAADLACGICLAGCTLLGLPVSTTHAKTAAVFGAGSHRKDSVSPVRAIGFAWLMTFPACFTLSYLFLHFSLRFC